MTYIPEPLPPDEAVFLYIADADGSNPTVQPCGAGIADFLRGATETLSDPGKLCYIIRREDALFIREAYPPENPTTILIVETPEGWAPSSECDVPPFDENAENAERVTELSVDEAEGFVEGYNRTAMADSSGLWAVIPSLQRR
jgi:hypothetical protein